MKAGPLLIATMILSMVPAVLGSSPEAADTHALPPGVDPDTGYRMGRYRAPVPDRIPGGTMVDADGLAALIAEDPPILIDVYPPKGAGADPLDGSWRVSEAHATIPGSVWLPEVGRGYLEDDLEDYFLHNLERVTGGDPAARVVFFCISDCWQAWNAARRAIRWGYRNVHWFPSGTDGWRESGRALVPAQPVNFFEGREQ
ncbi:MAG: rhodanese-like domain-containing protein [Pseudomonadota bacterium]